MRAATAARPAQFDRTSQHRRAMMAKIHIAIKDLPMAEDDYRQGLLTLTGQTSLTQCDEKHLEKMLDWLKSKGWRPLPKRGSAPAAQHPSAKKARALWISLYQLGVVHNPAEEALETFAKRQLGWERLHWIRQSESNKLIQALKSMAERAGWRQRDLNGKQLSPRVLQTHLCEVILARLKELGVAHHSWSLEQAAFRLCGIELESVFDNPVWPAEQFHRLAAALGKKLREAAPNAATAEDDAR